jgi:hypothetical protein
LYVKQVKTGVELHIPVHPALKRSLDAYGIKGQSLVGRRTSEAKQKWLTSPKKWLTFRQAL